MLRVSLLLCALEAVYPQLSDRNCSARWPRAYSGGARPLSSSTLTDMQAFIDAVRQAVAEKNWYAALAVGLTLPDIASNLEKPKSGGKGYKSWAKRYIEPKYTSVIAGEKLIFLSAADTYALRCAILHEGGDDITTQIARESLERFRFSPPVPHTTIHNNRFNDKLQLQVDIFCMDLAEAADRWMRDVISTPGIQARMAELVVIDVPANPYVF